jgi:hypothetical protein
MNSWTRTHQRNALLTEVSAGAGLDDRIGAAFEDYDDFLLAAFQRMFTGFVAGLDTLLDEGPDDLDVAARQLVARLRERNPGLWAIVEENRENPALAVAWNRQWKVLMVTTGLDLDAVTEPVGGRRCAPAIVRPRQAALELVD